MGKKIEIIKFFLEDNKSGYKTKESFLKKNEVKLYNQVINYSDKEKNLGFKERIYWFIHNIQVKPTCLECEKELKFKRSLSEGYGDFCTVKCANKNEKRKDHIKKTINKKYGGPIMKNNKIKEKYENTSLERYGVKNIFKNKEYIKQKTFEKFGVYNINKLGRVQSKREKTNKERYGTTTPLTLKSSRNNNNEVKLSSFINKYNNLNILNGVGDYVKVLCHECDNTYNIYRTTLCYRDANGINPCIICNPIDEKVSIKEKQIVEFIKELGVTIIENDRELLKGKELDIYIPEHNLAIEFDGLYYHSDRFVDPNYHINKTNECEEMGVELVHVFEDEWVYKKEIIKSIIRNKLSGINIKIHGRKCEIKIVNKKDKKGFLNANHRQGTIGSKVDLGLYFKEELVSIMCLGQKRLVMGNKNSDSETYELLRFCNLKNTVVNGGASKLFKYFIRNYQYDNIISFADRRYSQGGLYFNLGFSFDYDTTPNYFYVKNLKREHRFKYRKSVLVEQGYDSKKTEKEIMGDLGYLRIYDCGSKRFTYENKKTPN